MKPNEQDINELMSDSEKDNKNDIPKLNSLHKFHSTYSSDEAIWWYTKEAFFYENINTILRKQDIHKMFLWRSFLFDICHQLRDLQWTSQIKVYRGQNISKKEFETLKKTIGKLISVNSFWSTSTNRQVAAFFVDLQAKSDDMIPILFQMEADPLMVDAKPFANISHLSQHPEENEVLFMFGSIFRLEKIYQETERIWIIEMRLCDDDDDDIQEVLKYIRKQNGNGETNLETLGKLMWQMGYDNLATEYYQRFLKTLEFDDLSRLRIYQAIGLIESQNRAYDDSLKWQQRALKLEQSNASFYAVNSRCGCGCEGVGLGLVVPVFFIPCENSYDYTVPVCGESPCYQSYRVFGLWDLFVNNWTPILLEGIISVALILRVQWQKRRLHQSD
ncbi:hypothetical protein I4U23_005647 [Adineta vaga]|nr:hypothetical protein I4U23_005647 [Adineta vaga]